MAVSQFFSDDTRGQRSQAITSDQHYNSLLFRASECTHEPLKKKRDVNEEQRDAGSSKLKLGATYYSTNEASFTY